MTAPNRAGEASAILKTLPVAAKTPTDEGRRANLFTIIRALNKIDAGQWGALVKTDQGNKIPGDILVWRPTMEHFDVITGAGDPAWIPDGVITYAPWQWFDVGDHAVIDVPDPEEPDPDPFGVAFAELARMDAAITAMSLKLDAFAARPAPIYKGTLFGYTITLKPG